MRWSILVLCALAGALSACGGGGGSGNSGGGVSVGGDGAFTLSGTSATFSGRQNASLPGSQSLAIQITGSKAAYVGAAYPAGQSQPSWLGVNITGSGTTYNLVLSIKSTALAPGQYSTTFGVGTADSTGNVLASQSVTVTYTVLAAVAISTAPYAGTFTYGGSKTSDAVTVSVTAPGLQWKSASDSPWLVVPAGNQSDNGSLSVTVNVASLAPGTYQGHVTVTDASDATNAATLAFSVTIQAPTLTVTQTSILLGGADGLSTSTPQSLTFSVGTDTAAHPFTITLLTDGGGSWLKSDVASGAVSSAGAAVQISGDRSTLVGGTYTGRVDVAVTVGSVVLTGEVPVTFNVEANRIVVGTTGVGFSSWPGSSVLTREVTVFSAIGRTDVAWQASSDQSWLTVTPSGVTGGALTLTASAAGLSTDSTHFATVTVKSSDPTVENQETIRVGLYVASAAPVDQSLSIAEKFVAASPVEPIVFVSNGGTDVTGYNVYTGAVDRTLAGVAAQAESMVVSGDGKDLFVYDFANQQVTEVDATTGALVHNYPSSASGPVAGTAVTYVRPNGFPMLITPSGRGYDLATGTEDDSPALGGSEVSLEPSPDNSKLVADSGVGFSILRSALNGGTYKVALLFSTGTTQGAEGQACFSVDGQTVYTANAYPPNYYGWSLSTQQVTQVLPGESYPNSIACVWNGLIVGGADGYYDPTDVYVYDGPTGVQLAKLNSSSTRTSYRGLVARGLAVSADGTRVVTVVGPDLQGAQGDEVRFQSLPVP